MKKNLFKLNIGVSKNSKYLGRNGISVITIIKFFLFWDN